MAHSEPGRKLVPDQVDCPTDLGFDHGAGSGEGSFLQYDSVLWLCSNLINANCVSDEAGYEALAAEGDRRVESTQYTEKTFLMTRKFIKYALEHPVAGMEDVVAWNYLPNPAGPGDGSRPILLRRAIEAALAMIEHYNSSTSGDTGSASAFVSRLSLGAVVMLRKHVTDLEKLEAAVIAPAQS